jgi:hypothetical protein
MTTASRSLATAPLTGALRERLAPPSYTTTRDTTREQRSLWLGHGKRDATSWYETHDPEFLRECAIATDLVIDKLDSLMKRKLVPSGVKSMQKATAQDRAA